MSANPKIAEFPEPQSDLAPRNLDVQQTNFSYRQTGQRLGVSCETIRAWVRKGKVRAWKYGGIVRIPLEEILRIERGE
jgi:excisionase family DNA binding protein